MDIKTFWCEDTGKDQRYLRRYSSGSKCVGEMSYHDATIPLDIVTSNRSLSDFVSEEDKQKYNWPVKCESCDYIFDPKDNWQFFKDSIYYRTDTNEELLLRKLPPGACYNAFWLSEFQHGDDGICLVVCVPPDSWTWMVDGDASNCTLPNDKIHKCWVRHGDPKQCNVTVDKNGLTCLAGAGSILTPKWHGYLRNGMLVTA